MKKYKVEITETLQKIVEVEAENREEAIEKVIERYEEGDIVLDDSDYMDCDVHIFEN